MNFDSVSVSNSEPVGANSPTGLVIANVCKLSGPRLLVEAPWGIAQNLEGHASISYFWGDSSDVRLWDTEYTAGLR